MPLARPAPDAPVAAQWVLLTALFHGEPATRTRNPGIARGSKPVAEVYTAARAVEWLIRLNWFTGKFDEGSVPIWQDGELLLESVRRFKGQAAQAVVKTECDMAQLDHVNRRLLFVGLTRARVHLEWVISQATAMMLDQSLNG